MKNKNYIIIKKNTIWIFSIIITVIITATLTWYISNRLTEANKTKIYEYAYDSSQQEVNNNEEVECWASGIGNRSDSYKCTKNNLIFAPCFRDTSDSSNKVKCPDNPYDNKDAKYFNAKFTQAIEPLMNRYGQDPTPWYIYLSSGEKCRFIYGASATIANRRMDFSCNDSNITLYLPIKNSEGVYTIGCMKNGRLEECKIKEIWR